MAGEAAGPGAEPLAFPQCWDPSAPRLARGYGQRSLRELRESEFGRLAGETRAGASVNLEGAFGLFSAPGGSGTVSFGERFEGKEEEGCVHLSALWILLPGVPPVTPRPLAAAVPWVLQWGSTDLVPFHLP